MKHNYQFCAVPYEAVVALSNCKNQSALVVYMQLFLNSVDNKVMITRGTLSKITGLSTRTINYATNTLESLGLIKKEKHFNMASTYYIVVKELEKKQETVKADSCDTVDSIQTQQSVLNDTYKEQLQGCNTLHTCDDMQGCNTLHTCDDMQGCNTLHTCDEEYPMYENEGANTRVQTQGCNWLHTNIRELEFRNTILNNTSIQNEYSTREAGRSSKDECRDILREMKDTLDRAVARCYDGGCTWSDIVKLCLEYKNKTYTKLLLGGYFETVENFSKEKYEEWFNKIIAKFKTIWDNNNTVLPA